MSRRSPAPPDATDDRSDGADGSPAAPSDRKARLFCQACDHASPVDGDWVVVVGPGEAAVYRCPACGNEVERRPSFGDDPGPRAAVRD